jgi:hypothetical protein
MGWSRDEIAARGARVRDGTTSISASAYRRWPANYIPQGMRVVPIRERHARHGAVSVRRR